MSAGKLFVAALLSDKSVAKLLSFGNIDHLFRASEVDVWDFVKAFVKEHHTIPKEATIIAHTGEKLLTAVEPASYYLDLMKSRHVEITLKKAMTAASEYMLPENKDPEAALETMTETVMSLLASKYSTQIVDFRQSAARIIAAYVANQKGGEDHSLMMGWPTVDGMTGGLVRGDKVAIVGRPAAGKTWQMLYSALFGWRMAELTKDEDMMATQSRLFVSMEMGSLGIEQRLAAMYTHKAIGQLKKGQLSTPNWTQMKDGLKALEGFGAPFYVVDGNLAATVEDIWMLARQLNPGAIYIDGGYLVKHPTEKDRFRRVAENAELMKSELANIAPTVVSWQFARSASKKNAKKGEKTTIDDIGYTDAIGQVSSLVMGMFEDESVATLKARKMEILKGRNGEVGSFRSNWNFMTMDFDEIEEIDVKDLEVT